MGAKAGLEGQRKVSGCATKKPLWPMQGNKVPRKARQFRIWLKHGLIGGLRRHCFPSYFYFLAGPLILRNFAL